MTPAEAARLDQYKTELTALLDKCKDNVDVVTHIGGYLARLMFFREIEDHWFDPGYPDTSVVDIEVVFPWDLNTHHKFTIRKSDDSRAAYDRAMGII